MGLALDGVGVDHGGSDISVAQKLLDGPDVVVGLQEVAGKAVPEGVGGNPLWDLRLSHCMSNRLLHVGFMQMIPFSLAGLENMG